MAFEDRCSPQSAPSPPGVPHSPQKTSIILSANGNESPNSLNSYTIDQEMSMMVPTVSTQIANAVKVENNLSPSSRNGALMIKQEKRDERVQIESIAAATQQKSITPIRFSITNILSSNFGNAKSPTTEVCTNDNTSKIVGEKRGNVLFRPYDNHNDEEDEDNASTSPKPAKIPRRQPSDDEESNGDEEEEEEIDVTDERTKFHQKIAIDFSSSIPPNDDVHRLTQNVLSPQAHHLHHHQHHHHFHQQQQQQQQQQQLLNQYQAAVVAAQQSLQRAGAHNFIDANGLDIHRSPLYADFFHPSQQQTHALAKSLYPKLHEDILNSSKHYQNYYQTTRLLSDSVLAKYPPLGNLCKTVSQIGQTPTISPNPTSENKLTPPTRTEPPASKKAAKRNSSSQLDGVPAAGSISNDSISATTSTTPSSVSNENSMANKVHQSNSMDSGMESSDDTKSDAGSSKDENGSQLWPAWIYCTRYSDRPSSGPRYRKPKTPKVKGDSEEKRPRTAFSSEQLARLKREFAENRYLTERRRQQLSAELGLNEAQIKIWFQNKRAKIKKSSGQKNPLAMQLMAQGLYNHSTVPLTKEEEELEMRMNGQL